MSIDAVALLRIGDLPPPPTPFGGVHPVRHRGDATLINLMVRYLDAPPDELALCLRQRVGAGLDSHQDNRGVLVFPDVCDPQSGNYDALVAEIGGDGVWTPIVGNDHVPLRYRTAPSDSLEALTGRLIETLGRDLALERIMFAEMAAFSWAGQPGEETASKLADALAPIESALGVAARDALRMRLMERVDETLERARPIVLED